MTPSLKEYIKTSIIPRYASFDKAHREDHVLSVIDRALEMGRNYDINEDILYAAAAYHDLGLEIDRKTHHLESGRIIREDITLRQWFTEEQIETIAQAAEDHRASAQTPPRDIYGSLVAEADRLIVPETVIKRTVQFGLTHYPELDKEGHWRRTLEHLHEKYAEGGYLHLLIPGSPNEKPLEELREIIRDEDRLRTIFEKIYSMDTDVQDQIDLIRRKEDEGLHRSIRCSQCIDLARELKPYLASLKSGDYDAFNEEYNRLVDGLISFVDSFVKRAKLRYVPDNYLSDFGISDFTDALKDAKSLISYISHMDLSPEQEALLNNHMTEIEELIRSAKTTRKKVLHIRRRNRLRYFLDGPVIVGLIVFTVIVIVAIIKLATK